MAAKKEKAVQAVEKSAAISKRDALIHTQTRLGFFAAERIVFIHRPDIHTSHVWHITEEGMIMADSQIVESTPLQPSMALIALKSDLSPATREDEQQIITSAIEVAKHIEGPVAGRIVTILYRMANDPPNWRTARFSVDVNQLMDELGYSRTKDQHHDAQNRAKVRDVLLALSRVEIRGERFDPYARDKRQMYTAPLVGILGGSYSREETRNISLAELLEHGLPRVLDVELRWYEGVRKRTGEMGNNYVLLPRELSYYQHRGKADFGATEDRIAEFLWLRYSLQRSQSQTIVLTLDVALTRAGIFNSNITRARQTLAKALDALQRREQIMEYSPLPTKRYEQITIRLQLPNTAPPAQADLWGIFPDEDNAREEEDAPEILDHDPLAELESIYLSIMRIGGMDLSAIQVWQGLLESLHITNATVHQNLQGSVRPLWQLTTLDTGDLACSLYIGAPAYLVTRLLPMENSLLTQVAALWKNAFGIQIGPVMAETVRHP